MNFRGPSPPPSPTPPEFMRHRHREAIGHRLAMARRGRDLEIADLSRLTGIPARTLQNWEAAASTPPADQVALLCAVLRISADYLVGRPNASGPVFLIDTDAERYILTAIQIDEHFEHYFQRVGCIVGPATESCTTPEEFIARMAAVGRRQQELRRATEGEADDVGKGSDRGDDRT